ncbi:MAG: Mov34/MPN/PAD-1 family protein [Kiloniellales bacterium]|nr:Mov34/MPN/PAD-1 family protein [Kiloniellales bacterium]
MHILKLTDDDHTRLWSHLLPQNTGNEQAAFLFCRTAQDNGGIVFEAVDHALFSPSDFAAQYDDYIELTDEARIGLIKRAHHSETALAELHSHPGPWPAAFSRSDRMGLRETVPHMRWRLKHRPYLAIVVAPSGFDALVWSQNANIPEPLAGIDVEGTLMTPTNNSLEGWGNE